MLAAGLLQQLLVQRADAGRLVDRQLLFQRQVHAHVQEGVGFALLRHPLALGVLLRAVEQVVVFRMQHDHAEQQLLQIGQRLTGLLLLPGIEKETAGILSAGCEHHG
ncbi:hypothetical protein D3C78_1770020 [compost metagenome]